MNTAKMRVIGKGAFSTAYQKSKCKVLIKSQDRVKECMSLGFFPDTVMFPKIKEVGRSKSGIWKFYEERFYPRFTGAKHVISAFEWEFYRCLRGLTHFSNWDSEYVHGYDHWKANFESLPGKFHVKKEMLLKALDGLKQYGTDIAFEISPRNVSLQRDKLVLLDCFFFTDDLDKLRSRRW